MKRQTDNSLTSRNYTYGCVPERVTPIRNAEAARVQLKLANRLWNVLVTIERHRVARYRKLMFSPDQERADAIGVEIKSLLEAIRAARKKARNLKDAKVVAAPMQSVVKALQSERKEIIIRLKETSESRHAKRKAELEQEKEIYFKRITRARQAAGRMGLFWGTYNNIIQRADTAKKLGDCHYKRFTGEGTLTAQIMGGMTVGAMENGHSFFQLDPVSAGQKWRYARLRIGSNPDRSPIWLEIPIVYHRELPAGALIKSVSASRKVVADKVRWSLTVTCTMPKPEVRSTSRTVAFDVCWRLMPNGVRAGYWHDGDCGGEILVPMSDIDQFRKIESLRSICDLHREETIPMLAAWLDEKELTEEWKTQSAFLAQWKSSDRLARLVRFWSDHRLANDQAIFDAAIAWRKQYLHLANWWRNLSEQMTLRVREQYRIVASQLVKRYDVLLIEDFNLTGVIEKSKADSDKRDPIGTYRQMVSPATLRGALVNAFMREGGKVEKMDPAGTTQECHICGDATPWNAADNVIHRCANGHIWDQDLNADMNLLKRYRAGGVVMRQSGYEESTTYSEGNEVTESLLQSVPQMTDNSGHAAIAAVAPA